MCIQEKFSADENEKRSILIMKKGEIKKATNGDTYVLVKRIGAWNRQ